MFVLIGLLALGALTVGCGQDERASPAPQSQPGRPISIDGSATLAPVSQTLAESFQQANRGAQVAVTASGTGAGFDRLCAGQIDIAAASRPINSAEIQACRSKGLAFYELPVAFDSLSVVVNPQNSFATCLTVAELKRIWAPSDQRAMRWNQVRSSFPDQELALVGPGPGSGTFDYFTLAVNGTEGSSRTDYSKEADPAALANRVAADTHALGYLGYAYYVTIKERLKLVAIDNGEGCVSPSPESVINETYQPLTRPIFIYVAAGALSRSEVKAFARYYLSPDNAGTIQRIGYVPLPVASLLSIASHLEQNLTGTMFGGRGAVVGVTAAAFEDDERVKSALVR